MYIQMNNIIYQGINQNYEVFLSGHEAINKGVHGKKPKILVKNMQLAT